MRDLFDEVEVNPRVSSQTLAKIKDKYIDLFRAYPDYDNDKKDRIKGLKNLILQGAQSSVMQEAKDNGFVIDFDNGLFGGWTPPVSVRGSQRDVEAFAQALAGEKKYIETAKRYGLDHPTTYKNKAKLSNSVKGFEKETGIKWPFK